MWIDHWMKKEADAKRFIKKKCNKSNLIDNKFIFYSYSDNEKFDSISFKSKYWFLIVFYDLKIFSQIKPKKLIKDKEKEKVYNAATKLYNRWYEKYNQYEQ